MVQIIFRCCKVTSEDTVLKNYSWEKCRKKLCSDNLDKVPEAGKWYYSLNQQANDNPINEESLNTLLNLS